MAIFIKTKHIDNFFKLFYNSKHFEHRIKNRYFILQLIIYFF